MQEMHVRSRGREDPLEEEMATHSSILAWEIPWTEEPGGLQSMGSPKSQTQPSNQTTNNRHVTDPLGKEEGRSPAGKNKRGQLQFRPEIILADLIRISGGIAEY